MRNPWDERVGCCPLWLRRIVCAAAIGLVCAMPAGAQTSKGIISGTVRDQNGAAIAQASVTVTGQDSGERRTTTTSSGGAFRVDALNPGIYAIHISAPGFSSADVRSLNVQPSVVTSYNAVMQVGRVTETVVVQAGSNGVETENSEIAGTISAQEMTKVPMFTQNPIELVATLPGVMVVDTNLGLANTGISGDGVALVVNGKRPRDNTYMIDGEDVNDVDIAGQAFQPIIEDAFQTVTVLTSVASAEYGRGSGAIVNLVTKSGTNTFHGSAWEMYEGSGLDSLDGVTRQGKPYMTNPKARYDIQQPGFTAGGPIFKNKLFVFGGAEWSRFYGNATSGSIELPDAAGYAQLSTIGGPQVALLDSYLSGGAYLTTFKNLSAGQTKPYANQIKIGTRPGCTGGCTVETALFQRPPVAEQNPDTEWLLRADYTLSEKDNFSYRYLHDRLNLTPDLQLNTSGLPGFDGQVGGPSEVGQGTWTHVFTSHLVNEARGSETRVNFLFSPTPNTLANPLSSAYTLVFSGQGFGLQGLGISQNIPQGRSEDLYQLQDTATWVHGRHTVRVGADLGRQIERELVAQEFLGQLTFTKGGGQSPLDNFLDNFLGASGQATKTFGPTRIDPHDWKMALFGQDDVKLTQSLTLNLGLRYDYITNPENSLPYPAVDINNPFQAINTVVLVQNDKNNFSPRIGFAWNPRGGWFKDGKTVFHGGFASFYDIDFSNIAINAAQTSPNAPTGLLTQTTGRGLGNATGLLATITPTLKSTDAVESVANNLMNPVTYQYNFGIQRELPWAIKATVNYVGDIGENLYSNQELNYFVNGARLGPTRGAINIRSNRGASNYNGLQTELARQFSHGLFLEVNYTFSKDLDDASEVFSTYAAPTAYSADLAANDLHADWGPSVWDHRHSASFAYAWTPAGFHASDMAADAVLSALTRHFTISGTTQLLSGPYTTFNFNGIDSNGDGSAQNDRPLVGNPSLPYDTAGADGAYFGPPFKPGTYYDVVTGNPTTPSQEHWLIPVTNGYVPQEVGRNSFLNPGLQYWNLALEKAVPTTWFHFDRGTLVFRAEAQNFTNHDNTGPLDLNLLDIGTPAYMNRQNAVEAMSRHMQLWAKFTF